MVAVLQEEVMVQVVVVADTRARAASKDRAVVATADMVEGLAALLASSKAMITLAKVILASEIGVARDRIPAHHLVDMAAEVVALLEVTIREISKIILGIPKVVLAISRQPHSQLEALSAVLQTKFSSRT